MQLMIWNARLISHILNTTKAHLVSQYPSVQANQGTRWFKAKKLSLERLDTALQCGILRRKLTLLHRIKVTQLMYATQEWNEESLERYCISDAMYLQLKQQIVRNQQLKATSSMTKLSLKISVEKLSQSNGNISQVEQCLTNDRHFNKQKVTCRVAELVYRLGGDLTPCRGEIQEIQSQLVKYFLSRFHIMKSVAHKVVNAYLKTRVGILDRPVDSNQSL